MANLDYIQELGIGEMPDTETEAVDETNTDDKSDNDLSLEHSEEAEPEVNETEVSTDMQALQSQILGMEKRIADKDDYINELREASKQREAEKQQVDTTEEVDDEDFWDNPEQTIKSLQAELKEQRQAQTLQSMQIQETIYANSVDDYWKTVNPDVLQEAVATDKEFAETFNKSREPYKTAYEYLKTKSEAKVKSETSLREQIRKELQAEMGIKEKKEVPPNINSGGKSGSSGSKAADDGFASVFGSSY